MDEFVKEDLAFGDIVPYDVGPDDFIDLIAEAEIVLTDSFHGTMFSIYFHKAFATFSRFAESKRIGTNSRIASVLYQLGLEDQWINADEDPKEIIGREIDWGNADACLDGFRSSSLAYLRNTLEGHSLTNRIDNPITVAEKRKEECTGCTACVHCCPVSAIRMERDHEGFDYPTVDQKICLQCGLCLRTCPVHEQPPETQIETAYVARNLDHDIRMHSSSGGLFSSLAESILDKNGMVVGAAFSEEMELKHVSIEKRDEIDSLRASKYVQSSLDEVFKNIKSALNMGRRVLFCGTPCQVAGLQSYLDHKYENLLLVDMVCYGVPSPGVFKDFVAFLENKNGSKLKQFYFRDKTYGYASPNVKAVFTDNSYEEMTYDFTS